MGQCQEFFGKVFTHARFPLPCYWIFVFFSKIFRDIAELLLALIPLTLVAKLVADVKNTFKSLFFCKSLKNKVSKFAVPNYLYLNFLHR
jgi:hypothetical protein